jgi:hypothetical protein
MTLIDRERYIPVTVRQEEKEEEASSSNPDRQCVLAISNLKSESELVNDDDDEIQFTSPRSESTHTSVSMHCYTIRYKSQNSNKY